jgi:hypothetical protein
LPPEPPREPGSRTLSTPTSLCSHATKGWVLGNPPFSAVFSWAIISRSRRCPDYAFECAKDGHVLTGMARTRMGKKPHQKTCPLDIQYCPYPFSCPLANTSTVGRGRRYPTSDKRHPRRSSASTTLSRTGHIEALGLQVEVHRLHLVEGSPRSR